MEHLGITKNRIKVVDRYKSHLNSSLRELVKRTLGSINLNPDAFQEHTAKFKKYLGYSNVVKINKEDKIFYAKRIGRKGYSKFVEKLEGCKSRYVTLVLLKSNKYDNEYVLVTAYIGKKVGPEPYDERCKKEDRKQWKNLAFVPHLVDYDKASVTYKPPDYWVY